MNWLSDFAAALSLVVFFGGAFLLAGAAPALFGAF